MIGALWTVDLRMQGGGCCYVCVDVFPCVFLGLLMFVLIISTADVEKEPI